MMYTAVNLWLKQPPLSESACNLYPSTCGQLAARIPAMQGMENNMDECIQAQ